MPSIPSSAPARRAQVTFDRTETFWRLARRRFAGLLAVFTLLLSLVTACGASEEPTGPTQDIRYLIGMSQANLTEPWRVKMNEEIKIEAARRPDVRVIFSDAGQDSQKQIDDIKKMIKQGIDLLIVSPNNAAILTSTVVEAYRKIPVIVLDRAIDGHDYTLFIGPDNKGIGMQAGRLVAEMLGKEGGKIIEIQGLYGSPPVRDRSEGFRQVISEYPNIRIVRTIFADWLRDRAEDRLLEILKEEPDVDVIFAQNDPMAYGAYKAARELGLDDIRFVGIDGLLGGEGGLELVRQGVLTGTFTCSTGGTEAFQYALDILNKSSGIPKKIILRSDKVTMANVDEQIRKVSQPPRSATVDPKSLTVGFSQLGTETEWRRANTESILAAAREAGVKLLYQNANGSQEAQIASLRDFIRQGVDAIILAPIVETGWDAVLQEVKQAGIPVILSNRYVAVKDSTLYAAWVGSDFLEQGRKAANWLVGKIGETSRPVRIVEIQGTAGSSSSIGREAGFAEVLKSYPNYQVIHSVSTDYTREMGRSMMAQILTEHAGEIDVLYAFSDDVALGAITAIEEAGLKPGQDILIVSVDGEKSAFEAMIKGKLNCTVENNPLFGSQIMKAIIDLKSGKSIPMRLHSTEGIFPAEIARQELPNRKY